jgi:hypothetical protein
VAWQVTSLQSQCFEYQSQLNDEKEKNEELNNLYQKMYKLERLVLNPQKADYFSGMQESVLNSIIEYLDNTKFKALQLYHKNTNDLMGIQFSHWVMSAIDSVKALFELAKKLKNTEKAEVDTLTWTLVKWQEVDNNSLV